MIFNGAGRLLNGEVNTEWTQHGYANSRLFYLFSFFFFFFLRISCTLQVQIDGIGNQIPSVDEQQQGGLQFWHLVS